MGRGWVVSTSPHMRSPESTAKIMWQVVAALVPAAVWGIYTFGWGAARVMALSIAAAVFTEFAIQKFRRVKVSIADGSAVVTGLLLAYVLPSHVPLKIAIEGGGTKLELVPLPAYVPIVGAFVAIAIAKQAFGGLGSNIWNPALVGRAFVQVAWPGCVSLSLWPVPRQCAVDALAQASPLAKEAAVRYPLWDLFIGNVPGCIGEVSKLLLILGGAYLIARRYVNWRLPLAYIAVAFAGVVAFKAFGKEHLGALDAMDTGLYHVLAGGLMLGALFMATDMVTTPLTSRGQVIFGIGAGVLTVLIRFFTGYPEGVCYSILLMNTATPIIDRHTRPKVFGRTKEKAKAEA